MLAAHGWEAAGRELGARAARGDWGGMAECITDEMLAVYATVGTWDELPAMLRRKYDGVIDRLGFYALPGLLDAGATRALVAALRG